MTLSAIAYALTFVTVRALSEMFSVYMLVMLRAAIGTAILIPWLYRSGVGVLRASAGAIIWVSGCNRVHR